ncbi:serine/threonine-protein kinase PknK [Polyangium aurulentum]|uniref:serine/threonine-protein kinase n=1 Tax=Polyangium aurulentum TaxID=2567896 RepID=UPI0010AE0BFD|nr:serine/threonine-protein kinase [Polyangium aurulentum]UQA59020.1 protein kinase [Polyangium aurulentum]
MLAGTVLDGRFEVEVLAGSGGMGAVYRALDRTSGSPVALKLLREGDAHAAARFVQEARALSELAHPSIVHYVSHGKTSGGEPYLVMEWLAGETLAERLAREGLRLEEGIALVRTVAEALGAAHARGIVHRDIKPNNLYLVNGSIERVKVLDFGIARLPAVTTRLTQTGIVLGTPGYMAPEQARGEQGKIDPRADVFSLGCVLFECLTGRPAFQGQHVMALLAKLLFEEPPRVRDVRPDVPEAIDDLVWRMMAKDPAARLPDGATVARHLAALGEVQGEAASPDSPGAEVITGGEKRLLCVVAVRPAGERMSALRDDAAADARSRDALATARRVAIPLGARVEKLADGAVVAAVTGAGSATDLAALAARCALELRAALSEEDSVALVTGRSEDVGQLPLGELLERAASLLDTPSTPGRAQDDGAGGVRIDRVTRALLDVRFEVAEGAGSLWLHAEREIGAQARKLLGKPSPYVGRDRELRNLTQIVEESFEDRRAAVALVTAEAGMGKSRLRYELLEALKKRHPGMELGVVRGDSIGAGSAFAMLAGALRSALGIATGEAVEVRRDKLDRAVGRLLSGPSHARVTEFLGELIGAPFPEEDRPFLRAARQSPALMAERIQEAFLDYARAVTDARPMLVVLEDLHWGDAPSVRIFDRALQELGDRPFAVIAFARPEVHALFPGLWSDRRCSEMRLHGLLTRAAERLVRSALGENVDPKLVAAIVARAAGNAFYLEELIRAVAEGGASALPETVLGMVEARLSALEPEARRLLRAASVFGEVCWVEGVRALLGTPTPGTGERNAWAELFEREILERRPSSRFVGQEEIGFRHALLREGAYAMLTDRDRALGHKLAGEWLLGAGEGDPMVLAEHFERGGEGARAAEFYLRAAEKALLGADLPATIARAERGLACGAAGETLAALHVLLMDALYWSEDQAQSYAHALAALGASSPGSLSHGRAMAGALARVVNCDDRQAAADLLRRAPPTNVPLDPRLMDRASRDIFALLWEGMRDEARQYMDRVEKDVAPTAASDRYTAAWLEVARGTWCAHVEWNRWGSLQRHRAAAEHFNAMGDRLCAQMISLGTVMDETLLGAFERAEPLFAQILASEGALGFMALSGLLFRTMSLLEQRRVPEALEQARALHARLSLAGSDHARIALSRLLISEGRLLQGDLAGAEEEVHAAGDPAKLVPYLRSVRLSLLAEIRLRQGQAAEAVALAREAHALHRSTAFLFVLRQEAIPVLLAEALHASGDIEGAREAIREARDVLMARAQRIEDPDYRRCFLENIRANARTQALAREWLSD